MSNYIHGFLWIVTTCPCPKHRAGLANTLNNYNLWWHKWRQRCHHCNARFSMNVYPDSKVHGANMGPTWVLSAPDGPHEPCYLGNYIPYLYVDVITDPCPNLCAGLVNIYHKRGPNRVTKYELIMQSTQVSQASFGTLISSSERQPLIRAICRDLSVLRRRRDPPPPPFKFIKLGSILEYNIAKKTTVCHNISLSASLFW